MKREMKRVSYGMDGAADRFIRGIWMKTEWWLIDLYLFGNGNIARSIKFHVEKENEANN